MKNGFRKFEAFTIENRLQNKSSILLYGYFQWQKLRIFKNRSHYSIFETLEKVTGPGARIFRNFEKKIK